MLPLVFIANVSANCDPKIISMTHVSLCLSLSLCKSRTRFHRVDLARVILFFTLN